MLPVLDAILADRPVAAYVVSGRGALFDLVGSFPGTYSVSSGGTVGGVMPGMQGSLSLFSALNNRARSTADVPASLTGDAEFSIEMFVIPRVFATLPMNGWGTSGAALGAAGLWCTTGGGLICQYAGGNPASSAAGIMDLGKLNHVVYTKTPGAIAANSKFFANGRDTGSVTGSSNTPNIGASPFTIGQWADYNGSGGQSANAIWQLVAFYDKALDVQTAKRHLSVSRSAVHPSPRRLR